MTYRLMENTDDPHIPIIHRIYKLPSVSRFISIDDTNYWNYVTATENVWFYKVFETDRLIGSIHLELSENVLYMDIVVFPQYQNKGFGTQILKDILDRKLGHAFDRVRVSIDKANTPSIALFGSAGFLRIGQDAQLLEYEYSV